MPHDTRYLLIAMVGLLAACGEDSVAPPPAVATVELRAPGGDAVVGVGGTLALSAAVTDAGGAALTDRPLTYESGDSTIATVSATGLVTGVRLGQAEIRAQVAGVQGTLMVTVSRTAGGAGWQAVDAGGFTTSCGLYSTGLVYCWGGNSFGQIGNGSDASVDRPTRALTPDGMRFVDVRNGANFACALASSGDAYCWGSTFNGIGSSQVQTSTTPVRVELAAGRRFVALDGGFFHACGVTDDGAVYCWGRGTGHLLGTGNESSSPVPVRVAMPPGVQFDQLTVGSSSSCARARTGDVYCWGQNDEGNIGNGLVEPAPVPTRVSLPAGVSAAKIGGGAFHHCAMTVARALYCWGSNAAGQIASGVPAAVRTPVLVPGTTPVAVSGGNAFSCAVDASGTVACWGSNDVGQLGTGTTGGSQQNPTRIAMPADTRFDAVGMGNAHGCALGLRGEAYCWGQGSSGQLGNGTQAASATPVRVAAP